MPKNQGHPKPQLNRTQQRRVTEARQDAQSTPSQIAEKYGHTTGEDYAFAYGVHRATIRQLLEVIGELADEQPQPTPGRPPRSPHGPNAQLAPPGYQPPEVTACGQPHPGQGGLYCTRPAGHAGGHKDEPKDHYWPRYEDSPADQPADAVLSQDDVDEVEPDPGPLYVVWEVDDRDPDDIRRTVVSDPRPKHLAEEWARHEAPFFAGRLEVAPARPVDLAPEPPADRVPEPVLEQLRRDGKALGLRIAADEGLGEHPEDCGHPIPPGACEAGYHCCRNCLSDQTSKGLKRYDADSKAVRK